MKNLFTRSLIILTAILALASCSTSSFITKRRYTRGYYVSHHSGKNATRATEQKANEQKAAVTVKENQNATTIAVLPEVQNQQKALDDKTGKSEEKTVTASGKAKKAATKTILKAPVKQAVPAALAVQKPFKSVNKAVELARPFTAGEDALSLFWIVILVILILWLLGLIGGIGWFINILLIVALVLLILWLLRIV